MCDCLAVRKEIEGMSLKETERQLVKCERCAFKKEVGEMKAKTYEVTRLSYVSKFWKNQGSL